MLGAAPVEGLFAPVGSPGLGPLVLRFVRSILSSPTEPLVPGIEDGLFDVLLPVPAVPGDAVAPDPEVALPAPIPVLPFAPPADPPVLAPPDAPPALPPPALPPLEPPPLPPPLWAYAALATPNRASAVRVATCVTIFMIRFLWLF